MELAPIRNSRPKICNRAKVNYFLGNDPSKWRSNIPLYGRVNYQNLYPGVDLAFHGVSQQLEFDYLVSPGADPAAIALSFEGADSIRTDGTGDLVLATSAGPVQLHKPVAYQSENGARQAVDARFVLKGKNQVAFELGSYDHTRELVIDPTVTYSTYFGGNGADYGVQYCRGCKRRCFRSRCHRLCFDTGHLEWHCGF